MQWICSKPCSIPTEAHPILKQYLDAASQQPVEQGVGLVGVVSIIYKAANGENTYIIHDNPDCVVLISEVQNFA